MSKMQKTPLSRDEIYELVWQMPMTRASAELGLSPNGLSKICDRMLIPYPGRGYWGKSEATRAAMGRPDLPRLPEGYDNHVVIGARSGSRRKQTRLTPDERREQLIAAAIRIIETDGLHAANIKRVAREVGVSETLAFRYFRSRDDLLIEMARREISALRLARQAAVAQAQGSAGRIRASTEGYLRKIEERGSILHLLINVPAVRRQLRGERHARLEESSRAMVTSITGRFALDADLALGMNLALSAATRRAGRVVATGKAPRPICERLVTEMIEQCNRDVLGELPRRGPEESDSGAA